MTMEAKEFIQTTIDNTNIETEDILKQHDYLEAISYFDIEADLLYDEFRYLSQDKQLKFLQGLSKLLPFSQKLYAKFIEHVEQKEEFEKWIIKANEKYLDTLYEIFGGGDFEQSYEEIEDRILELNETLEKLEVGYLHNKMKQKNLTESLNQLQRQNGNVLDEITQLENSIEQSNSQYVQQERLKKQLKNDIEQLQTKTQETTKKVENFQAKKDSLQKELSKLEKLQKENDIKLKQIKEETQKVLSQNELYKKEQKRLKQCKHELQTQEKATKLIGIKLKSYFGSKKTNIEKELEAIKTSIKNLQSNFEKSQEEKIVEDVSKGEKS